MSIKRLFRNEGLLFKIGAQATIISVLGLLIVARGSLSTLPTVNVIALLLFNLLIWCRRPVVGARPWLGVHLYLALQSLLLSWLIVHDIIFGLLVFILYVQAMLLSSGLSRLAWMLLFFSMVTVGNIYLHPGPGVVVTPALRAWVFQGFLSFVTIIIIDQLRIRRKSEEVENLLEDLKCAHQRLAESAETAGLLAAEEERNRISRDLHDSLGHRLTNSIVLVETLPLLLTENGTQRAVSTIDNVSEQLHLGLQDLRATVRAVRNPYWKAGNSLTHMLRTLADEFAERNRASVWTRLTVPNSLPLSDDQRLEILRIVQEALTNIQKHAQARNVYLTLKQAGNELILVVRNDGRDFPSNNGGSATYGLQGMRERAALLGGTIAVEKPDEGGTAVTLTMPLEA